MQLSLIEGHFLKSINLCVFKKLNEIKFNFVLIKLVVFSLVFTLDPEMPCHEFPNEPLSCAS